MRLPGLWRARMAVAVAMAATLSSGLRASVGAPALAVDASLSPVARAWAWAARMASAGAISHNPDLATQVTGASHHRPTRGRGADDDCPGPSPGPAVAVAGAALEMTRG